MGILTRNITRTMKKLQDEATRLHRTISIKDSEIHTLKYNLDELKKEYVHPKLLKQIKKDEFSISVSSEAPPPIYPENGSYTVYKFHVKEFSVRQKYIDIIEDKIAEHSIATFKTEQEATDFIKLKEKYK